MPVITCLQVAGLDKFHCSDSFQCFGHTLDTHVMHQAIVCVRCLATFECWFEVSDNNFSSTLMKAYSNLNCIMPLLYKCLGTTAMRRQVLYSRVKSIKCEKINFIGQTVSYSISNLPF